MGHGIAWELSLHGNLLRGFLMQLQRCLLIKEGSYLYEWRQLLDIIYRRFDLVLSIAGRVPPVTDCHKPRCV